jgi:hypothetical protein
MIYGRRVYPGRFELGKKTTFTNVPNALKLDGCKQFCGLKNIRHLKSGSKGSWDMVLTEKKSREPYARDFTCFRCMMCKIIQSFCSCSGNLVLDDTSVKPQNFPVFCAGRLFTIPSVRSSQNADWQNLCISCHSRPLWLVNGASWGLQLTRNSKARDLFDLGSC